MTHPMSALTRFSAREGRTITNPLHYPVAFNPPNRYLVQQLDGTRSHQELGDLMTDAVRAGQFSVKKDAPQANDLEAATSLFVTKALQGIARAGLLIE